MCNVGFASIQCMEGTCLTVEKAVSQTVDKIHVQFSSESAKNRKKSENVLLNSTVICSIHTHTHTHRLPAILHSS